MTTTTDEVIDRFSRAFQERDATLLEDIIAPDCSMESIQPAPDGTRYEGHDASFSWGPGPDHSLRGVNVMRVVDGNIVEAAGYSKTAPTVAALES